MKKLFYPLLCWLIFSGATASQCNKPQINREPAATAAVITGYDARLCPCCGGLMINFNGATEGQVASSFLIENDLSAYGITDKSRFPIFVQVAYTALEGCNNKRIRITQLIKK